MFYYELNYPNMCGVVGCCHKYKLSTRCHVSQYYPPTQLLLGGMGGVAAVVWCSCEMQQQPCCGGAVVAGP